MNPPAPAILALALAVATANASEVGALSFQKAQAVLAQSCLPCHSHAAGKSHGGLLLDSRAAILAGGNSGPALVPGKPQESRLLRILNRPHPETTPTPETEPPGSVGAAALTEWIAAGAPWPETRSDDEPPGLKRRTSGTITDEDRRWWAFQPVRPVVPPTLHDPKFAVRNDVDRFIGARLAAEKLTPSPEASRAVLIRRVTLDLTGLPPSPEDVAGFTADAGPDAYERLVDRLLASPAYGERMARQWLDLVRYADSDGYRLDDYRPDAWRYRDYVIQAFNSDKPYTRFIQEQLAGDELFPDHPEAQVATGYLRHWIYEYNSRDVRLQWDIILNDLTDTTGDVFFGLGLQCARCHDHKFDPILQRDYYRLRAFLASVQPGDRPASTAAEIATQAENLKAWETKTAALRAEIATLEQPYLEKAERDAVAKFPDDIQALIRKPAAERTPLETQLVALAWRQVQYEWDRIDRSFKPPTKEQILSLRHQLEAMSDEKPTPLPVALAVTDVGPVAPAVGIPKKPALGNIEPGVLTVLDPAPAKIIPLPNSTGRRSALARWLTAPGNPLTARVMVNRAWQQHFGRGLAANASDFGVLGEKPTHPELLDWLAGWFEQEGWSLKKLHRLLVTSAAYRRSSEHPEAASGKLRDPENRLLWRWQPRRLDAEQIRDSMLAVSGELDPTAGGPGVPSDLPRRTIFTRYLRNTRDPLADVFDAPLWFTSAASRDTTTTPVQSLLLANGASLRARGRAFAARLVQAAPDDLAAQVQLAYPLAFGRAATATELDVAQRFLTAQTTRVDPERLAAGQANFASGKIPFRDGQAAFVEPEKPQSLLSANDSTNLPVTGTFTIEAFFVARSVAETGDLRTLTAKGSSKTNEFGWSLGITGQKSRRRPLTIALPVTGRHRDGTIGETIIHSDLVVQLDKPYFVAAAYTAARSNAPGQVVFSLKDLANDDEPLLTATVEHDVLGELTNALPVTLGARSGEDRQYFHGLIDDVRLSAGTLAPEQLLYRGETLTEATLGYWKFEAKPDVFADSSGHGHSLRRPPGAVLKPVSPTQAALGDFCHALLNSSEFLYPE